MKARCTLLMAALTACTSAGSDSLGGQTGSESGECLEVQSAALEPDEDSVLGFSGADVLALAAREHESTLVWADGISTGVTLDVSHDGGAIHFIDSERVSADSGQDIAMEPGCGDHVTVEVTITLRTADGAFDETWPATLVARSAERVDVVLVVDPAALAGSYEVDPVEVADCHSVHLQIEAMLDAAGVQGMITGTATRGSGDGSDDPVSSCQFPSRRFEQDFTRSN